MGFPSIAKSGFWLLSDQIFGVIGGVIFWLIIANIVATSTIGQVSVILGFASIAGLLTLGLEFIVLREVSQKNNEILGTFFILQIILLIILSVIIFSQIQTFLTLSTDTLALMGVILIFSLGLWEFATWSVIGMLRGKFITIVHLISVISKVILGVGFVTIGLGAEGILLAIILQVVISTTFFLSSSFKKIGFHVCHPKKLLPLIKLALGNYVNKVARIVTTNLTFLLLPVIASDLNLAGIFYIQYTIALSLINTGSVLAILSIPASRIRNEDISPITTRLGLYLLAPLITILLTTPSFVLGFFGSDYSSHPNVFRILIISVLPAIIIWNFTASLNSSFDKRRLIILGLIQLSAFGLILTVMNQQDSLYRISFSILGAFIAGASYALISMGKKIGKALTITIFAVLISTSVGLAILQLTNYELVSLVVSGSVCVLFLIKTDFSLKEIKNLFTQIKSK